ncbi:hypothetical protein BJV82DRAFT_609690 [Fennellomyces sp. T-0311]|nr:hypothetical protein BJV82DRAFT_609690 [Fennellomyces sp. T-0311]
MQPFLPSCLDRLLLFPLSNLLGFSLASLVLCCRGRHHSPILSFANRNHFVRTGTGGARFFILIGGLDDVCLAGIVRVDGLATTTKHPNPILVNVGQTVLEDKVLCLESLRYLGERKKAPKTSSCLSDRPASRLLVTSPWLW